jgi:hypothetical protein
MGIEVVTMKEHLQLAERLERLEWEVLLQGAVLAYVGWIPAVQVMAMGISGLTSWKGLNSAAARGDLVIDKSKRKALVSIKSLMHCLRKRGYTTQYLQARFTSDNQETI